MLPLFSPPEDEGTSIPRGIARVCSTSGEADAKVLEQLYIAIESGSVIRRAALPFLTGSITFAARSEQ